MKFIAVLSLLLVLTILYAGCRPATAPPTLTGAPPAATVPQKPAGTAAPATWQKKWDDTLAAAKKEGELLIYLNAPAAARMAIPEAFKQAFGIQIKDGFIIGYLSQRAPPITYNTEIVRKDQITSYLDLLKPE